MSLINRMLQDLDRRQALEAGEAKAVRVATAKPARREWFWRALVVLLTAALAWMGWVAVQLLPRKPLATELAYRAASEARVRNETKSEPAPVAPSVVPAPAPTAAVAEAAPVVAVPPAAPSNESLRLETELKTPAAVAPVVAAPPEKPKAAAAAKGPKEQQAKAAADKPRASAADAHFRRATLLLKEARVGEAEDHFQAALQADPRHTAARQAYVSLLLEQQRVSTARGLLQDTLAVDPAQASFALSLARIHAMGRDYAGALGVLDRAAPDGRSAEFQAYRGTMLQRLGRHDEAIAAYQSAVRDGTAPATAWIGYAMSLEAVGKRSDAAMAYRRALTMGPIAAEAREYAESRARALE